MHDFLELVRFNPIAISYISMTGPVTAQPATQGGCSVLAVPVVTFLLQICDRAADKLLTICLRRRRMHHSSSPSTEKRLQIWDRSAEKLWTTGCIRRRMHHSSSSSPNSSLFAANL